MDALSRDEIRALLAVARARRERDFVMILVAFSHGLRASEVTQITPDAIRDGYLTVKRLKGSLRTTQPLVSSSDPLFDEATALVEFFRKAKRFGIGRIQFWRLVHRYAVLAGIPKHKAHPHVLKHSIAMQTIASAGIQNVRQYLGHKSMSSTGAYLRVSDDEAAAAIRKAVQVEKLD